MPGSAHRAGRPRSRWTALRTGGSRRGIHRTRGGDPSLGSCRLSRARPAALFRSRHRRCGKDCRRRRGTGHRMLGGSGRCAGRRGAGRAPRGDRPAGGIRRILCTPTDHRTGPRPGHLTAGASGADRSADPARASPPRERSPRCPRERWRPGSAPTACRRTGWRGDWPNGECPAGRSPRNSPSSRSVTHRWTGWTPPPSRRGRWPSDSIPGSPTPGWPAPGWPSPPSPNGMPSCPGSGGAPLR